MQDLPVAFFYVLVIGCYFIGDLIIWGTPSVYHCRYHWASNARYDQALEVEDEEK